MNIENVGKMMIIMTNLLPLGHTLTTMTKAITLVVRVMYGTPIAAAGQIYAFASSNSGSVIADMIFTSQ